MGREVSFDLKQSIETFGCRAKAVEFKVDPSSSFALGLALGPLDDVKLCQGDRFRHYSIDDKYLFYKGRVCIPIVGDFCWGITSTVGNYMNHSLLIYEVRHT